MLWINSLNTADYNFMLGILMFSYLEFITLDDYLTLVFLLLNLLISKLKLSYIHNLPIANILPHPYFSEFDFNMTNLVTLGAENGNI